MSALDDRVAWLDHLHTCTICPGKTYLTGLCRTGYVLTLAVRASMAPGETWHLGRAPWPGGAYR